MLRRKPQSDHQLLPEGKGQWEQGRRGARTWHLPNGVEVPPSRCSAVSLLLPKRPPCLLEALG